MSSRSSILDPQDWQPGPWHPLLEGAEARAAQAALRDIAAELRQRLEPRPGATDTFPTLPSHAGVANPTLGSGLSGLAVLFAYLALADESEEDADLAVQLLDRAMDAMVQAPFSAGLHNGMAGVAFVANHLEGRLLDSEGEQPMEELDQLLLRELGQHQLGQGAHGELGEAEPPRWDLTGGTVGLGVYGLELTADHPAAAAAEMAALCLLDQSQPLRPEQPSARGRQPQFAAQGAMSQGTHNKPGDSSEHEPWQLWWRPPSQLPQALRPPAIDLDDPRGLVDLGLAHGMAGPVAFLARLENSGRLSPPGQRVLGERLEHCLRFLAWLEQRCSASAGETIYPDFWHPELPPSPSRAAWCSGDPAVATALLAAGEGRPEVRDLGLRVALRAAQRARNSMPQSLGVMDPGLCHGAAGQALLFARLYQLSGVSELGDAARLWLRRTLEMRRAGVGISGFGALRGGGEGRWDDDPGLLAGAAGVALTLLAATTSQAPDWDRALLLSPLGQQGSAASC